MLEFHWEIVRCVLSTLRQNVDSSRRSRRYSYLTPTPTSLNGVSNASDDSEHFNESFDDKKKERKREKEKEMEEKRAIPWPITPTRRLTITKIDDVLT